MAIKKYTGDNTLQEVVAKTKQLVAGKQDKLTAGTNITIDANNVISATGGGSITVDDALSSTSTNPVQNKVINSALGNKVDKTSNANKVYGTDSSGNQTNIDYSSSQTNSANKIVQRDNNRDVLVPSTPTSNNGATSKSYVDGLTTPTQWQNATLNSTYISNGTCRYCVVGKIVIVQMWDILFTQSAVDNFGGSNNLIAISGLPNGYAGLVSLSTAQNNIIGLNVDNGNMSSWYSSPLNTGYYYIANFTYIKE